MSTLPGGQRIVVVTGSRVWNGDRDLMATAIGKADVLIVGDALGADLAAFAIGRDRLGLKREDRTLRVHYAADHGKWPACGPKRSLAMVDDAYRLLLDSDAGNPSAVICLAFPWPGEKNQGTRRCVQFMKRAGFSPVFPEHPL